VTKDELVQELEHRIGYAERVKSTAQVSVVLQDVLNDLIELELGSGQPMQKPDRMLTAKEAAPRLGMSTAWLYRNADSLPFTKRYPTGAVKFSARGLEKWLSRQR
jgi:predicted DNA-binding transcriptional regulator AlpA